MFSMAGADFDGSVAGQPLSPRLGALVTALGELLAASDEIAACVRRHDREALEHANERADAVLEALGRATATLGEDDRLEVTYAGVPELVERLQAAARRNAYLIESAWAIDAAEIRLLAGLGRLAADGGLKQYAAPSGPAYVDRQA